MTKKRNDNNSTPFGLWIRDVKELDSKFGYTGNNLDFFWWNYKTKKWMFIEEKSHGATLTISQKQSFPILDKLARADENYKGFYIITLENTTPEDGRCFISQLNDPNRFKITTEVLIKFLRFEITFEEIILSLRNKK